MASDVSDFFDHICMREGLIVLLQIGFVDNTSLIPIFVMLALVFFAHVATRRT